MRIPRRFALLTAAVAVAALAASAADEPAPLLKPVTPPAERVRVRVQTSEEKSGFYHFAARIPKAKGKKGETEEVAVAFECRPGKSYVTAKKWQSWGYEVGPNRTGVLPELVIPATQLAPKVSRGLDVEVKIASVRLEIIEPPGGADTVVGCDLLLAMNDLTRNADRAYEPRLYFADQFLEFTVPSGAVKRLGTGNEPPPVRTAGVRT